MQDHILLPSGGGGKQPIIVLYASCRFLLATGLLPKSLSCPKDPSWKLMAPSPYTNLQKQQVLMDRLDTGFTPQFTQLGPTETFGDRPKTPHIKQGSW